MNRIAAVLVVVLVASMAVAPAGASAATDTGTEGDALEIRDLTVAVSDVQVSGTGLPDWSVEHATYTVEDATVGTDGFTVVWNGEEHEVGAVQVTVDDVGVVLEDVSLSSE